MKHRYLLITLLVGCAHQLVAQNNSFQNDENRPNLRDTFSTIDEVDAQFQARQSEIFEEQEDVMDPLAQEDAFESGEAPLDDANDGGTVSIVADPESAEPAVSEVGEVEMDFGDTAHRSIVSRDADTISVDFPDEDVRTIIRNVADLYELNVVIPDTLVGRVSLKLRDVSWRQVFDVVLEPLSYTWIEDRNIIRVRSQGDLLAEAVATRVFVINFARAGELQSSISPLVDASAGGRIQVDSRSNSLVITERPSRMNDIQAIIDRLDRPTDQVMIESKFVEITQRDAKDVGINWNSLGGYEVSAGPFNREYESERGRAETGDASPYLEGSYIDETGRVVTLPYISSTGGNRINDISRIDTAFFDAAAFSAILSALQTKNDVELVSNPTVVTINNTPAQINIGEEFPIPRYTYNDQQGRFEVSGFDYKPIGILLKVTPQVNQAGFINLDIAPEISSQTGESNFGGAIIPIVTTRKTQSTVTIKSGFTLAIGGLMETNTGQIENKVPVLGDVPLLGRLFRSNSNNIETRNLIIFITAKVLNPDGSTYRDVFSEETLLKMGISERKVPGYQPSAEEKALYDQVREERETLESLKKEAELRRQLETLKGASNQASDEKAAVDPTRENRVRP